jgi:hypothetical protein
LFGGFCLSSQVAWYSCGLESNCVSVDDTQLAKPGATGSGYNADWGAQLRMKLCSPARVESCDFEAFGKMGSTDRLAKTALIIECSGGSLVTNCGFFTPAHGDPPAIDAGCVGIRVTDAPGSAVTILPNSFANVETAIRVGRNASSTTVFPQETLVQDGVSGESKVYATGLALLALPTGQIQAPTANQGVLGQLVYDSTLNVMKCWTGSEWKTVAWAP